MDDLKATYSIPETAKILGISRTLCYNLASKGELPILKLGKRRMVVPRVALEKMLEMKIYEYDLN